MSYNLGVEYHPGHKTLIRAITGSNHNPMVIHDLTKLVRSWLTDPGNVFLSHVEIHADRWAQVEILEFILPFFLHTAEGHGTTPATTTAFTIKDDVIFLNRLNHRALPGKRHHVIRLAKEDVKRWLPKHHINTSVLTRHIEENGVKLDADTVVPICPFPVKKMTPQVEKVFLLGCIRALNSGSKITSVVLVPWKEMTVLKFIGE